MTYGSRNPVSSRSVDYGPAPSVTVVIPCFNRADMIGKAVRSALDQSQPPLEVIVVDDGSTQDIAGVLGHIRDERLRVVRLEVNAGGANARNVGIDAARGTLVALLDSDDWWSEDKLAGQFALITEAMRRDDNWLIYNKIKHQSADGFLFRPSRPFDPSTDDLGYYMLVEKNYIQTSGLLAPTALLRRFPFDIACRRHQDVDLLLRLHMAGIILIYCDRPTVIYNDHGGTDRVGQLKSVEPSIDWIRYRRSLLGRKVKGYMNLFYIGTPLFRKDKLRGVMYMTIGIFQDPLLLFVLAKNIVRKVMGVRNKG